MRDQGTKFEKRKAEEAYQSDSKSKFTRVESPFIFPDGFYEATVKEQAAFLEKSTLDAQEYSVLLAQRTKNGTNGFFALVICDRWHLIMRLLDTGVKIGPQHLFAACPSTPLKSALYWLFKEFQLNILRKVMTKAIAEQVMWEFYPVIDFICHLDKTKNEEDLAFWLQFIPTRIILQGMYAEDRQAQCFVQNFQTRLQQCTNTFAIVTTELVEQHGLLKSIVQTIIMDYMGYLDRDELVESGSAIKEQILRNLSRTEQARRQKTRADLDNFLEVFKQTEEAIYWSFSPISSIPDIKSNPGELKATVAVMTTEVLPELPTPKKFACLDLETQKKLIRAYPDKITYEHITETPKRHAPSCIDTLRDTSQWELILLLVIHKVIKLRDCKAHYYQDRFIGDGVILNLSELFARLFRAEQNTILIELFRAASPDDIEKVRWPTGLAIYFFLESLAKAGDEASFSFWLKQGAPLPKQYDRHTHSTIEPCEQWVSFFARRIRVAEEKPMREAKYVRQLTNIVIDHYQNYCNNKKLFLTEVYLTSLTGWLYSAFLKLAKPTSTNIIFAQKLWDFFEAAAMTGKMFDEALVDRHCLELSAQSALMTTSSSGFFNNFSSSASSTSSVAAPIHAQSG